MKRPERQWTGRSRGGRLGHLTFFTVLRLFGPRLTGLLLHPVVVYFLVALRGRVTAVERVLERTLGPAGFFTRTARGYRLFLTFARCLLDRATAQVFGRGVFTVTSEGREHFAEPLREGKGVILLSAHLGAWETASLISGEGRDLLADLAVVMLDLEEEAVKRANQALGSVHRLPQIIAINRGDYPALRILEALRAGRPVAMHGDRIIDDNWVLCDFLGARAPFPTGAFVLAAAARVPIVLTFAFHLRSRCYQLVAEPPRMITLPRKGRAEALAAEAQWYAERLAHYTALYPYNWFNFYDFWALPERNAT